MRRLLGHGAVVVLLTMLTQLGGVAWLAALALGRRWVSFPLAYAVLWGVEYVVAPMAGREALPCFGAPLRMQSPFYCVTMRNYVTPEMALVAQDAARRVAEAHPGTVTLALDGSLPFGDGIPLLPHLSHDDGEKLDLAFYYAGEGGYLPGRTWSPLGYFAFEALDRETCPRAVVTLRWDMRWVQGLWRDWAVDVPRSRALVQALVADARVAKVFVEPPLAEAWGVAGGKVRFRGCRAARHDDHVHVQL